MSGEATPFVSRQAHALRSLIIHKIIFVDGFDLHQDHMRYVELSGCKAYNDFIFVFRVSK